MELYRGTENVEAVISDVVTPNNKTALTKFNASSAMW